MPKPSSGSVPSSHSTGVIATSRATSVSFTSFTNHIMSTSVIANARPKNVTTPRAPSRMSPIALANPMMCTDWRSLVYLARSFSSSAAKSK